jgi:hypothetical protein
MDQQLALLSRGTRPAISLAFVAALIATLGSR